MTMYGLYCFIEFLSIIVAFYGLLLEKKKIILISVLICFIVGIPCIIETMNYQQEFCHTLTQRECIQNAKFCTERQCN
ncbi:MAG: hypothetical protein RSC93_02420 [Erysipelotrichaceae bacterium]